MIMTEFAHIEIFLVLIGSVVGSFVVTAAGRSVEKKSFFSGRSRCDGCGRTLSLMETVPILSFVVLLGRCRCCGAPIWYGHLIGEVAGAIILPLSAVGGGIWQGGLLAAMGFGLLASAVIDIRMQILPDPLNVIVAASSIALSALKGFGSIFEGCIAAGVVVGVLLVIRRALRYLCGDAGMGLGDVKLVAALALWLGALTPWMLVAASTLGLVATLVCRMIDRPIAFRRIAFGPALAVAGFGFAIIRESL